MTRRQIAWMLVLIVDAGFVVWGTMAAAWPDHLLGPSGIPIRGRLRGSRRLVVGARDVSDDRQAFVYAALAMTARPSSRATRQLRV